ncbi:MAG: glycosyltransferase family 9 protein [Candidatus Schekmanbacteria bacterium]|nr:glycosyltransferase family 9 protein [Candidatus Schekmanbacteria bacterium]
MKELSQDRIRSVVVRAPNWIGDCVMAMPAMQIMRQAFPTARFDAIAQPLVADVLEAAKLRQGTALAAEAVATGDPQLFDTIHRIPVARGVSKLSGLGRSVMSVRKDVPGPRRSQLGVCLPNSFESALLLRLLGCRYRLGVAADARGWLLTHAVRKRLIPVGCHHSEYYLSILAAVGISGEAMRPALAVPQRGREEARLLLSACGVVSEVDIAGPTRLALTRDAGRRAPLIVMHPGAAFGDAKRWGPEGFAAVAAQAVNILGSADVVVSNDSGPMHLAAALGTPVIAVFGPTNPTRTGPLGPGHTIISKHVECSPCELVSCPIDHRCMTLISEKEIFGALAATLAASRRVVSR